MHNIMYSPVKENYQVRLGNTPRPQIIRGRRKIKSIKELDKLYNEFISK